MSELKLLSEESIPKALVKAKHYRLLNEPWQAESICRDILAVDPNNQMALRYMVLSISDQLDVGKSGLLAEGKDLCKRITNSYEQIYFKGILLERAAKASLKRTSPRAKYIAYDYYSKAMELYEEAEKLQPEDTEDAVLRWNACLRKIKEHNLTPTRDDDRVPHMLDV